MSRELEQKATLLRPPPTTSHDDPASLGGGRKDCATASQGAHWSCHGQKCGIALGAQWHDLRGPPVHKCCPRTPPGSIYDQVRCHLLASHGAPTNEASSRDVPIQCTSWLRPDAHAPRTPLVTSPAWRE
eukprot:370367-Pleurochrysis_carterae.AAC.1